MTNLNDIAKTCLLSKIRNTSRQISMIYDTAFKPLGITGSQFIMLVTLFQFKQASIMTLSEKMQIDHSTLSRNIKLLIRDGLLQNKPDQNDARVKLVIISPKGYKVLKKAIPLWVICQNKAQKLAG